MKLDEQIQQHVVSLPMELKAEVLDFVLFLEHKREQQTKELKTETQQALTEKIIEAKKGHLPNTQAFIGVLAGSNVDENDYKQHLKDKYL
jgi:hypothetical protein